MAGTQIIAGTLDAVEDSKKPFKGHICLHHICDDDIFLVANDMTHRGDNAPDYSVYGKDRRTGEEWHYGNAWLKNSANGDFLSMTLDSVTWDVPLNLAAFPPSKDRNETLWRIVWSRPRRVQLAASQTEEAA